MTKNRELKRENFLLQCELEQLKRMVFKARRERFDSEHNPNQGLLFDLEDQQEESKTEVVTIKEHTKKKSKKKNIARNSFPKHLPRKVTVIEPEGINEQNWEKIGEDITETLAYTPGRVHVEKTVRPRYVKKGDQNAGVSQAPIPPRLIPKGMVDESLVAHLITEKIMFHTPVFRFRKKLKQEGIDFISQQNLYNWFHSGASQLLPLYHLMKKDLLEQEYLQCDETRIQVLSKNKPGSSIRGQMWVINQPQLNAVLFEYHPSRSANAAQALLKGFEGILQVDGYSAYEHIAKAFKIELAFCMAHARRKFFEAQDTDPPRARYFLQQAQKLYKIEEEGRENKLDYEERRALRQEKAIPILDEMGNWLKSQILNHDYLPKSPIGKALAYTYKRWKGLCTYAQNGQLEIDNNLVENRIRPLALGRKNYLFAGSDEYAQHLACLYSIVGTAHKYGLNIQKYMEWLLRQVVANKINTEAIEWLPHRMTEKSLQKFIP